MREGGTYKVTMWRPRTQITPTREGIAKAPATPGQGDSYYQCLAPVEEDEEEGGENIVTVARPVQEGGASSSTFQGPA
jgi:hypothetical protein